MTAGLEGLTVSRWLYGTLTDSQALQALLGGPQGIKDRVGEGAMGADVPEPFITWTIHPPQDVKVVGGVQVFSHVVFDVKVVDRATSYTEAAEVYAAVHALLETKTNQPVVGGLVIACHRVSGIQYPERADGIDYRHLGGTYAAEAQ